jgi:hypothetical protein
MLRYRSLGMTKNVVIPRPGLWPRDLRFRNSKPKTRSLLAPLVRDDKPKSRSFPSGDAISPLRITAKARFLVAKDCSSE